MRGVMDHSHRDGAAPQRAEPTDAPGRKRILVVDDDEGMRSLVGDILEDEGYECTRVQDGLRALSCVAGS